MCAAHFMCSTEVSETIDEGCISNTLSYSTQGIIVEEGLLVPPFPNDPSLLSLQPTTSTFFPWLTQFIPTAFPTVR